MVCQNKVQSLCFAFADRAAFACRLNKICGILADPFFTDFVAGLFLSPPAQPALWCFSQRFSHPLITIFFQSARVSLNYTQAFMFVLVPAGVFVIKLVLLRKGVNFITREELIPPSIPMFTTTSTLFRSKGLSLPSVTQIQMALFCCLFKGCHQSSLGSFEKGNWSGGQWLGGNIKRQCCHSPRVKRQHWRIGPPGNIQQHFTLTGDINMTNHKIMNLGTPHPTENSAVVNMGFFNTQVNESNLNLFT